MHTFNDNINEICFDSILANCVLSFSKHLKLPFKTKQNENCYMFTLLNLFYKITKEIKYCVVKIKKKEWFAMSISKLAQKKSVFFSKSSLQISFFELWTKLKSLTVSTWNVIYDDFLSNGTGLSWNNW